MLNLGLNRLFQGGAVRALSQVTEIDFDWPRRFLNSLSDQDRQNLIRYALSLPSISTIQTQRWANCLLRSNIVGHLGGAKSEVVRQRQVALFAHVDADFGEAIAKGVGVSVTPISFPDGPTWLNTTVASNSSTLRY